MAIDTNAFAAPQFTENPESVEVQSVVEVNSVLMADAFRGAAANEASAGPAAIPPISVAFGEAANETRVDEPATHPAVGPVSFQAPADPVPVPLNLKESYEVAAPPEPAPEKTQDVTVDAPAAEVNQDAPLEPTEINNVNSGITTIVTQNNILHDIDCAGEDLAANAPFIAPVAEVFDLFCSSIKDTKEQLPEREMQDVEVTKVVPDQQLPVQKTWESANNSFDGPANSMA